MEFKRLRKLRNYLEEAFVKNHIEASIEAYEAVIELENQGFVFDENVYEKEFDNLRRYLGEHRLPLPFQLRYENSLRKNLSTLEKFGFSKKEILGKLKENPNLLTAADDLELLSNFTGLSEDICDNILTKAENQTAQWRQDIRQSNLNYITQTIDYKPPQLNLEAYDQPRSRIQKQLYEESRRLILKNINTYINLVESGKASPENIELTTVGFPLIFAGYGGYLFDAPILPPNVLYNMMKANRDFLANTYALGRIQDNDKSKELDVLTACALLQCSPQALEIISNNVQHTYYDFAISLNFHNEETRKVYTGIIQSELAAAQTQEKTAELQ